MLQSLTYSKQASVDTWRWMWDQPPWVKSQPANMFSVCVETFINLTDAVTYMAHLFTCWKMSSSVSSAYRLIWPTMSFRTFIFFFFAPALSSIHRLPNFRPNTAEPVKHSLMDPFNSGAQTRTNTFIHRVPKMQMRQGPDTFTEVLLSWACVRQQRGCHSHRVIQGTTPMFSVWSVM